MERRLLLAKRLLNPAKSVLIVTIDEKEYLRLGLLLQQVFPGSRVQMVTVMTNKKGSTRTGSFSRRDEYVFYVFQGSAKVTQTNDSMLGEVIEGGQTKAIWNSLLRRGSAGSSRKESPKLFFPLWVDESQGRIVEIGDAIPLGVDRATVSHANPKLKAAWPIRSDGGEGSTMRETVLIHHSCNHISRAKADKTPAEMGWELKITPKMPTGVIWSVRGAEKEQPQWREFLAMQRQAA
jgi:adenine-specific DNA-methyltransferase